MRVGTIIEVRVTANVLLPKLLSKITDLFRLHYTLNKGERFNFQNNRQRKLDFVTKGQAPITK